MCYNVLDIQGKDCSTMLHNKSQQVPRCCEIWTCQLGENGPGVQSGYRPVLILSNNRNNLFSSVVNVAPLTTKMNKRNLPVHVELWDYGVYGLKAPSTILIEQTTTVNIDCLDYRLGVIRDSGMLDDIWAAIQTQFAVRDSASLSKAS